MNETSKWSLALVAMVLTLVIVACGGDGEDAAPATATAAAPTEAADLGPTGSVMGSVRVVNGDDPDVTLKMDADPVCAGLHEGTVESETLVADADGNLANAFVYIKAGLEGQSFAAPSEPALLTQKGCLYWPHVSGLVVGQTLKVVNQDPTLHNIHATPSSNPEFNQAQPFQGMELERTFDSTEVMIPFKCDVHPWMSAYLAVLSHPFFAVTGEDGSFSIDGLPAGAYTLEVWHETLGTQTSEVTIEAEVAAEVALTFDLGA